MEKKQTKCASYCLDFFFLSILLGVLFFTFLGSRPLFVPDEGRYAEIAREIIVNHDWITPTLNGITYFEKPMLFYWLGAIAIKIGGLNLWSLRSINALLSLLGCLMTYAFTRHYTNRTTGLIAAGVLATSSLYFVMTHMVSLDLPVTIFITATLMTSLLAYDAPTPAKTRFFLGLAASAAALAVLTKGLIGLVFPGLIFIAFIATQRGWKRLWQLPLFSSFLIFLIIAAPWHLIVNHRHPEFFYFYFIEQHFLRYTLKDIGHYQPVWFFIPVLLAGLFPWIVFLPQTLYHAVRQCRQQPLISFLLLWAFIIFAFFSFSKSKLIPYILPLFPPLAILTAIALNHIRLRAAFFSLILLILLIGNITLHLLNNASLPHPLEAAHTLTLALSLLLIGTGVCLFLAKRRRVLPIALFILTGGLFLVTAFSAFPDLDTRTIRPLAEILKPKLTAADDVITYDQYFQDLPFYLERRVTILNWRNEMTYGMAHQDTRAWMINDAEFWKRWKSHQRVFVFISHDELIKLKTKHPDLHATALGQTINTVLITNKS